ncbi:hypothetical protein B566_EDAN003107 [Ephemera danica]|nr:hypothetical protein B566_EDAN003107 [Ephemera danica]
MSGFSFGTAPNASVGTGMTMPSSSAPAFGFGSGTAFGSPATSSTLGVVPSTALPSFGAATSNTSVSFGGLGTATPSFGSNTAAPSFGAAAPSFGTSTAPPSFGAATSTGLTFNTPASSAGFGLGTSTAPTLNLNFGPGATTSTSSGFNFATPASTAASSFGLGGFSAAPQTSLSTGFGSLGGIATSTVGFGLGSSTTSFGGLGGQLGAAKPTLSLGTVSTASSTPFVGLGGVDTTISTIIGQIGSTVEQTSEKAAKDNIVPPEIMQQVEEFKEFFKQQKSMSNEFARTSTKPFHRIQADVKSLSHQLDCIQNQIQSNSNLVKKLRSDSAKSLQHAEMAQQTYDTPSSFQLEYFAPDEYFNDMASRIEKQLDVFKKEVENMQKILTQVADTSALKKDALVLGLKHLHSIFMVLAGRMQTLHAEVEQQKEACLKLRRLLLHDSTDIFEPISTFSQNNKQKSIARTNNTYSGPPLFSSSNIPPLPTGSLGTQLSGAGTNRSGFSSSLGFGMGQNTMLGGTPSTSFSGSSADAVENRPFQLQQPPVGNKRGKR